MQGQFHCNGYMYDNLLFGHFDTVAYEVQLDDNYLALQVPKMISQSVGRN